eukprot:CAMPEP_0117566398 /NCGR_PEP_ID=MMETSP0784-20121206/57071_1 /TAXON_ID=39447 /ORGANISM="" /LENGTH=54 /DNA_ID=CAMNT_0005364237 /DNA_START=460 /DNA_END=624 /DNA_ORIENTATION=-
MATTPRRNLLDEAGAVRAQANANPPPALSPQRITLDAMFLTAMVPEEDPLGGGP